jgi:hypothetical protein
MKRSRFLRRQKRPEKTEKFVKVKFFRKQDVPQLTRTIFPEPLVVPPGETLSHPFIWGDNTGKPLETWIDDGTGTITTGNTNIGSTLTVENQSVDPNTGAVTTWTANTVPMTLTNEGTPGMLELQVNGGKFTSGKWEAFKKYEPVAVTPEEFRKERKNKHQLFMADYGSSVKISDEALQAGILANIVSS